MHEKAWSCKCKYVLCHQFYAILSLNEYAYWSKLHNLLGVVVSCDMEVNKHRNKVDMGPKNEKFRIPNLMCLSDTFI